MPTKKELKQRQAIPLFLLGKTETEVAEAIGVSRQTIWKWRRDDDFDHDIVEAGEELLAQHAAARTRLREEQREADLQIRNWERQFIAQGGKPEDFSLALFTGKFDPHDEFRAKFEEMRNSTTGDTDSKPDDSCGIQ